jgi:transcriptional regulatory protein LEU3
MYICGMQLQLRVFYFFEGTNPDKRKKGILQCYETASTMIETTTLAELDDYRLIYAPNEIFRIIFMAGIVLMRILNSSYSSLVDFEVGKRHFNTTLRLLRQYSVQDNDNPGRGSKILSQSWIHHQNSPSLRESPPSLQIKSRFAASLMHDSLWIWRRECDDQKYSRRDIRQNCKKPVICYLCIIC